MYSCCTSVVYVSVYWSWSFIFTVTWWLKWLFVKTVQYVTVYYQASTLLGRVAVQSCRIFTHFSHSQKVDKFLQDCTVSQPTRKYSSSFKVIKRTYLCLYTQCHIYRNLLRKFSDADWPQQCQPQCLTFMEPCIARCVFYITNKM